ncbi:MAG: cysteine methyltransferase [Roseobacter sp. MedPE-SWchi]|nr:MAG: cysteine methyltransferase [Roseobacter sp. MedPE-SWchi]
MPSAQIDTFVGTLRVTETDGAITRLAWPSPEQDPAQDKSALLARACDQLQAYFAGELQVFDLPLQVSGSDFQRAVCEAMFAIPLGETRTYGDLARDLGRPPQPVGNACGTNPIPVIIPCHRILGANGLGGFSGGIGIETKITLLKHEGAASLLI